MLEKVLRSPFIMIVLIIYVGVVFVGLQEEWNESLLFYPFIIFLLIYIGFMFFYNKKHPENPIKWMSFIPYELREEDEGMQWISFKATRKVYIFYSFALPFGIILITFLNDMIPYFTTWLLVVFGVIQYSIYWFETREVLKEGE